MARSCIYQLSITSCKPVANVKKHSCLKILFVEWRVGMTTQQHALSPQRVMYHIEGGVKLVGDAWGNSQAAPILFLHGGGQTRHAWGGTARTLAQQGWHTVSLDLRGHGDSDWSPDGEYIIDVFVSDIRQVISRFHQPPVLVGASLGDITPRVEQKGVDRIRAFMTGNPNGFATLEEAADAVAAYIPHRPRPKDLSG